MISSPTAGQVLQGQVAVNGTSDISNFSTSELAFAYAGDSTGTWFVIQTSSQPIVNDLLGTWDTTMISDGDYILRLRVTLLDGSYQDATVPDLQIRNYTVQPTATSVPSATATAALPIPTAILLLPSPSPIPITPTPVPIPTPTLLPVNPAELTTDDIYINLQLGALSITGLFILFGILLRLRRS